MGNEVSQDPATGSRLVQLKTKTKLGTVSAEYISHPGSDGSKVGCVGDATINLTLTLNCEV